MTTRGGNQADLTLLQGKTIHLPLIWGGETPIDVTGYQAIMQVRQSPQSPETITEFTAENGRVTIGGVDGSIALTMSAEDSANLKAPFSGVYELEIITDTGVVHRGMYGNLIIEAEVAK